MKKFYKKSLAVLAGLVLAAQMLIPSAGIFGSNEAYALDSCDSSVTTALSNAADGVKTQFSKYVIDASFNGTAATIKLNSLTKSELASDSATLQAAIQYLMDAGITKIGDTTLNTSLTYSEVQALLSATTYSYSSGDVSCNGTATFTKTEGEPSSSSTTGGGGGGSSSSHKCKNLPANATANNTTKPKKDTDYTYSTNTGDVCTFQCNKDYTWNASTSKCEAESTTTTGDNNEVKQEEETPVEVTVSEEAQETYGDEMIDAYRWAAQKGITTILDADAANLASPITRAQLAKMMSVYAVKVLGRDLIVKDDVSYDDVDSSLGDLEGYIKLAYQLQIMGINADGTPLKNFNPNREVSRGEFVTVFSRVLFGNKFNQDGTEYYAKHMANLKELEILSVDDPDMQELRGWVILMLYRSQDNEGVTAIQEAIADEANAETPAEEETPAAEEAAPAEEATEETK